MRSIPAKQNMVRTAPKLAVTLHVLPGDRGPSSSSPTPLSLTTRDSQPAEPSGSAVRRCAPPHAPTLSCSLSPLRRVGRTRDQHTLAGVTCAATAADAPCARPAVCITRESLTPRHPRPPPRRLRWRSACRWGRSASRGATCRCTRGGTRAHSAAPSSGPPR